MTFLVNKSINIKAEELDFVALESNMGEVLVFLKHFEEASKNITDGMLQGLVVLRLINDHTAFQMMFHLKFNVISIK